MSLTLEEAFEAVRDVIGAVGGGGLITNSAVPNPTCCSDPRHLCRRCKRASGVGSPARNAGSGGGFRILNQNPFDPNDIGDTVPRCAADMFELDDTGRPDLEYIANKRRVESAIE
ncbi:hypothetical protein Pan44_43320 [Caulifigura coniformis]|uniref:Uncharacterized protein n=1 Tax=Caulifigura coniformis TaxID=2527983 RepID=A0A517SJH7_9PLAN|nr:hypothetical protein [Caulifigura coniformis]QDT56279.1 hypothetical protein Pan44_43320 [Caulifigura coniformis]